MKNNVETDQYEPPEWPVKPAENDKITYWMKDQFELQKKFLNFLNYRDIKEKQLKETLNEED